VKPRRSSRVASGDTGSGQGAVNYDEMSEEEDNVATTSRPPAKRGRLKRVEATGLGRGRRKHENKRAALRDAVMVASMRCDFADDIGAGEADGDLAAAVERSSEKVSKIAKRSREKADQNMAGAKYKCLAVQSAQAVGATKRADVLALGLKH
jgi:hypothetical protein